MAMERPLIGRWYKELETGALFEVVAWDHRAQTAEVQFLDGEIAEFDRDTWGALALAPAAEPEDWRTPFELSDEDGVDPDLPIIAFARKNDEETKVSARGTGRLVGKGLDLSVVMGEASAAVDGGGGGHNVAAGATIPAGREQEFIEHADGIVGKQLG